MEGHPAVPSASSDKIEKSRAEYGATDELPEKSEDEKRGDDADHECHGNADITEVPDASDEAAKMEEPYPDIFKDGEGNTLPIRVIDGFMYAPIWIKPTLHENLKKFRAKSDDIWVISYPRSGNHWVTNICWLLLHGRLSDINKFEEEPYMIDGHDLISFELLSPRIMRSHMQCSNHFPEDVFRQKNKVIYLYRDGRDVAVSWYKTHDSGCFIQYSGTWNGFFPNFLDGILPWGSWFTHVKGWMGKCRQNSEFMMAISYEDCKKDPVKAITRISSFLELQKTEAEIREIAEKTSFKCMKKRDEIYEPFVKENMKGKHEGTMYRHGNTGEWKSMFAPEQSERFNHKHQEIIGDVIP